MMAANKTAASTNPGRVGRNAKRASPTAAADRQAALPAGYYQVMFEQSPDAIVVANAAGQYVDANLAALALLGYERDALLRLRTADVVDPGPDGIAENYARFMREGHWEGEVEVRKKDGSRIPVEARVLALPESQGGLVVGFLRDLTERNRDEITRARLAAIVTSTADAVIGETLDGIITDWNPAAERLYGYTAAEAIGQPLSILAPPERVGEIEERLDQVRRGKNIQEVETVRRTRSGKLVDVSLTISPVRNDAGQILAASAIIRDITERKVSEIALAASEALFRAAFEGAPIGMVLTAPDGRTLQVNRAVSELLGYSESELLAKQPLAVTHPDDVAISRAQAARALSGEISAFLQEKRYLRKDGQIIWVILSTSLVRDETGAPRCFISHVMDITDRKDSEAELAATHQRTRQVLERITDGFYALDRDWRFTYVNEAAERVLGRARDELLHTNVWESFPPVRETSLYTTFHQAVNEKITTSTEFFYPPFDAWFEVRAYPSAEGLSVFFRDITNRKRADDAMRSALDAAEAGHRAQSHFLAMMSHELRTPMQAVLGFADLLALEGGTFTPDQIEDIGRIQNGATRMIALVNQVLDLTRMESGAIELAIDTINLGQVVQQVQQDVAPQAAAKSLELHVDLPPDLPLALADPMQLRQILLYLVANAVKFTREGSVRITAFPTADGVDIAVSDTGIGIPAQALEHVFDEFRQVDSGLSRRYDGAGLGLAISMKLVKHMGGSITVESRPQAGSTFTIHLPVP